MKSSELVVSEFETYELELLRQKTPQIFSGFKFRTWQDEEPTFLFVRDLMSVKRVIEGQSLVAGTAYEIAKLPSKSGFGIMVPAANYRDLALEAIPASDIFACVVVSVGDLIFKKSQARPIDVASYERSVQLKLNEYCTRIWAELEPA